MPAVTVALKPNGLPIASTQSPTRILSERPNFADCSGAATIFAGTKYPYLGVGDRLTQRFATVIGDTTRSLDVLIAAQHPPVAAGAIQETVYLHSGEVETGNVDLDADGRNGWNVVVDRTYHSRTMVAGPLGFGWSSSIFRSVRPLPNAQGEQPETAPVCWIAGVKLRGPAKVAQGPAPIAGVVAFDGPAHQEMIMGIVRSEGHGRGKPAAGFF